MIDSIYRNVATCNSLYCSWVQVMCELCLRNAHPRDCHRANGIDVEELKPSSAADAESEGDAFTGMQMSLKV